MSVADFYTMDQIFEGRPNNFRSLPTADIITECILYNCSARIEITEQGTYKTKGNSTEQGLINFLIDFGIPA